MGVPVLGVVLVDPKILWRSFPREQSLTGHGDASYVGTFSSTPASGRRGNPVAMTLPFSGRVGGVPRACARRFRACATPSPLRACPGRRGGTWVGAPGAGRLALAMLAAIRVRLKAATPAKASWSDDPEAELERALGRAGAAWAVLQVEAEVDQAEEDPGVRLLRIRDRLARAAELFVSSALDRLRPFTIPTEYIDIPPLRGSEDALRSMFGEDASLVFNFLSSTSSLSAVGRAFWQAELYLRHLHEAAGETPVEEAAREAQDRVKAEPEVVQNNLRGSVLLARQNFISAARFGYFLRRGRRRWNLERDVAAVDDKGVSGSAGGKHEELEGFLVALKKRSREFGIQSGMAPAKPRDFEGYLAGLDPSEAVELVRPASQECNAAIESRASSLFGDELSLMRELEENPARMQQLRLSAQGRLQLNLEAAAFGAALLEAEEAAARR
eukprot:CAMPEP_0117512718 /NCGR_PEP_ID=MMETSP0784-20121206/29179_1 /TAXON_ID=39447 /ORGANISM="" /LENGTH=442 /DNA_ID=CAMNT_0005308453 /DNA_START=92 /DNA_END=1416 /DNA_ORIENTATION=+